MSGASASGGAEAPLRAERRCRFGRSGGAASGGAEVPSKMENEEWRMELRTKS